MNTNETIIYILRHGETDWNAIGKLQGREDIELNEKGKQQAKAIAQYFFEISADVVVSSPLKRAFETAQIIANTLEIDSIKIYNDLTERCWGDASGMLPETRKNTFPEGKAPNQEEFEDLRLRGINELSKIEEEYRGKTIVVVSHGAIINSMLYTISNGEFGSFKTRLANACVNKIVVKNGVWKVEFYNREV